MKLAHYEDIRDQIQTGDMIEFGSSSIIGYSIRLFTRKDVNHTSIAVSFDNWKSYHGNRKFLLQADPEGIDLDVLSRELKNYKGKVYWYRLKEQYNHLRNDMGSWAIEQVGVKYDYGSLFKNMFGAVSATAKKFFCSEYNFFALVVGKVLPQYKINKKREIIDNKGKKVKAPRPGEFGKFKVYEERVRIY